MATLTTAQAVQIAQRTLAAGQQKGFAPLTAVVLDRGGHPLAILRDERSGISRVEIATAKAASCLGMGFGGRELVRRAAAMPQFFNNLGQLFPHGMVALSGGVLVRDGDGSVIGAVGVSGDTSDNDEIALLEAMAESGLSADTGD